MTLTLPPDVNGSILAVSADSPTDAWAVGMWSSTETYIPVLHWDGIAWKLLRAPGSVYSSFFISVTALSPINVWALVGGPTQDIMHWNGSTWKVYGGSGSSISGDSPSDVWTVGGSNGSSIVDHWNGMRWTATLGPGRALNHVLAFSPTNVWATYLGSDGVGAAHWDGSTWTVSLFPLPQGGGPDDLRGTPNDLWAVGITVKDSQLAPLAVHFDGSSWSVTPTPTLPHWAHFTAAVATLGSSEMVFGFQGRRNLTEKWDGAAWAKVKGPGIGVLAATTIPGTSSAWAVGGGIARYDC